MNSEAYVWEGKVLTEEDLRRMPGSVAVLSVRAGVVITPLAHDAIRSRGLKVEQASKPLVIPGTIAKWSWVQSKHAKLASAVMHGLAGLHELPSSGPFLECIVDLARGLSTGSLQGIIAIGEDVEVACVCVNKMQKVKAVAPSSFSHAKRIMHRIAPNFLGIGTEWLTFHEMVQIVKLALTQPASAPERARVDLILQEVQAHENR